MYRKSKFVKPLMIGSILLKLKFSGNLLWCSLVASVHFFGFELAIIPRTIYLPANCLREEHLPHKAISCAGRRAAEPFAMH